MSISPELAHIAPAVATQAPAEPANGHVAELAILPAPVAPEPAPEVKAKRSRPRWLASASVGVVAVVTTGTLGYTMYTASQQRDATQLHLAATQTTLTAARSDAVTRKVTADYVALYIADSGKVHSDYQNEITCDTYSQCRTVAQQLLSDLQAFQADRKSAKVPYDLAGADADLGDALSAAIAGDQEFIVGMDDGDVRKMKEGGARVDAAMLNIAKAQVALANHLK